MLYLNGATECDLSDVKEYLPDLLSVTTKQIYLDSFNLEQKDLNAIFDKCTKVQELFLVNCGIGDLDKKFKIDAKKKYVLKKLDLFWTLSQDRSDLIDEDKARIFFKAIAESKMKTTLKEIHACKKDYDEEDLKDLLKDSGLKVRATLDNTTPSPSH